jgi:dolichol-phosphate mannosyltransferase
MSTTHPTLSVIVPVYNEEKNLIWHHKLLSKHLRGLKISYELIYVNDGSSDSSLELLRKVSAKDSNARFLSFSRNFGKEQATSAGLHAALGDAAVMIDADGQHPIEVVDKFLEEWRSGAKVVVGIRTANHNEGFVKRYGSKLFNLIMNTVVHNNAPRGSTDFRLLDRQVIDEFCRLQEHNRITRGLIDWLGFKRSYVAFVAPERHAGKATYSVRRLIRLAIHALVSQTTKPLQITGYLGAFVMIASVAIGLFLLIEGAVLGDPMNLGITTSGLLALFISFLVGVVLTCQWLLALYIENIHNETQGRPLYIIEEQSTRLLSDKSGNQ